MRRRAPPAYRTTYVEIEDLKLDPIAHRVSAARRQHRSRNRPEFRMLHFFMTHPERVYSRAPSCSTRSWGDHVFVEERDGRRANIRRLRQALEPTEHDSLVETVRGTGYRFRRALP